MNSIFYCVWYINHCWEMLIITQEETVMFLFAVMYFTSIWELALQYMVSLKVPCVTSVSMWAVEFPFVSNLCWILYFSDNTHGVWWVQV